MLLAAALTWTALVTWSDGHSAVTQDLETRETCQEVLCSTQYGKSCDEHKADVAQAKKDAEAEDARVDAAQANYVKTNFKGCTGGKNDKWCPDPKRKWESWGWNRKDGWWAIATSSVSTSVDTITHAACFKPADQP